MERQPENKKPVHFRPLVNQSDHRRQLAVTKLPIRIEFCQMGHFFRPQSRLLIIAVGNFFGVHLVSPLVNFQGTQSKWSGSLTEKPLVNPPQSAEMTGEITDILKRWNQEGEAALHELMNVVYQRLRITAHHLLQNEHAVRTLQTTALINEAYLKLSQVHRMKFQNRNHFFWFAGELMRRILVEQARAKLRKKRTGQRRQVPLEKVDQIVGQRELKPETMLALDGALKRLQKIDPRQSKIVELKFFAGLKKREISDLLNVSEATISRDWRLAKMWLARELETG